MASRGRPRHPDILTPREWEVLALLRSGASNAQIAERLGITERTAKFHVSEILSKLGVGSREEAAGLALSERRPWWLRASIWAKIGLAATASAAIAGLGILAWGVLRSAGNDDEQAVAGATPTAASTTATVVGSYDDPFGFRSFGRRMAEAIKTRDVEFFVQNADFRPYACDQLGMPPPPKACEGQPPGTSFEALGIGYMQTDGGIMALEAEYRQFVEELLTNFDANASDEYGGGQTQLYAWAKIEPGRSSGYPDETVEAIVTRITQTPLTGGRLPQGASVVVFDVSYLSGAWRIFSVSIGGRGSGPGEGSAEVFVHPQASEGFFGFWSRWQD